MEAIKVAKKKKRQQKVIKIKQLEEHFTTNYVNLQQVRKTEAKSLCSKDGQRL